MPTIRITEAQDAYIHMEFEVSESTLRRLRKMSAEQLQEWAVMRELREEEKGNDWFSGNCGEVFELVFIDVQGTSEALYER